MPLLLQLELSLSSHVSVLHEIIVVVLPEQLQLLNDAVVDLGLVKLFIVDLRFFQHLEDFLAVVVNVLLPEAGVDVVAVRLVLSKADGRKIRVLHDKVSWRLSSGNGLNLPSGTLETTGLGGFNDGAGCLGLCATYARRDFHFIS